MNIYHTNMMKPNKRNYTKTKHFRNPSQNWLIKSPIGHIKNYRKMLTNVLRTLIRNLKWKFYFEICVFNTLKHKEKKTIFF